MAREVECKVAISPLHIVELSLRIDEVLPNALKQIVDKRDSYYSRDGHITDFRIREEGTAVVLTRKHKENRKDGVEVNHEVEFTVDRGSSETVHSFFRSLGYRHFIEKGKRGTLWRDGRLSVELVQVDGLGYYLEIERLLDDSATREQIDLALEELARLRTLFGIAELPLEPRYYIEMLQEKQ